MAGFVEPWLKGQTKKCNDPVNAIHGVVAMLPMDMFDAASTDGRRGVAYRAGTHMSRGAFNRASDEPVAAFEV